MAAAEAVLASAQAAYQEMLKGPGADELRAAQGTVDRARLAVDQAQSAYDQVAHLPNVGMLPQSLQLQQVTFSNMNWRRPTTGSLSEAPARHRRLRRERRSLRLRHLLTGSDKGCRLRIFRSLKRR